MKALNSAGGSQIRLANLPEMLILTPGEFLNQNALAARRTRAVK